MKKGEKWLLFYGLIILLILLFNSFVKDYLAGIWMSVFMGVCLLAFKLIMALFSPILDIFSFKGIEVVVLIVFLIKNFS